MSETGTTLLVVDHDPDRLDRIRGFLVDGGYQVENAGDGASAWQRLVADPAHFDGVILARELPDTGALAVLARVKQDPELQDIPVILYSADAHRDEVLEGLKAGAYHYLAQPLDREWLLNVLANAVEGRARYREALQGGNPAGRAFGMMHSGRFTIRSLEAARDLAAVLANACPDPKRAVVGLSELMINAIEHGNLGIGYEEKSRLVESGRWEDEIATRLADPAHVDKTVSVQYRREQEQIWVLIEDQGPGFDWRPYLDVDPSRAFDAHGRGIALSRLISFDSIEFLGAGNRVEVTVRLTSD